MIILLWGKLNINNAIKEQNQQQQQCILFGISIDGMKINFMRLNFLDTFIILPEWSVHIYTLKWNSMSYCRILASKTNNGKKFVHIFLFFFVIIAQTRDGMLITIIISSNTDVYNAA